MTNSRQMLGNNLNLDNFISEALQWDPNNWEGFTQEFKYREVLKMLPKYRQAIDGIFKNGTLHPKNHSIAYSYLLAFKASENFENDMESLVNFLRLVRIFVKNADPKQISLYPRPLTDALRVYVDVMKREKNYIPLIGTLRACIDLLQGSVQNRNLLTFAHCDFMFCCVQTHMYHQAYPYINHDIIQVQGGGCIRSADSLRYFYYCALIHIGMKAYKEAMECLTMVCTAPSESLSAIQADAYKKYILISLIRKQSLVPLPRYTPRVLTRLFPKICREYRELCTAFDSNANSDVIGKEKLKKIIERNAAIYLEDFNSGLVKKVIISCDKNAVKKLTSVYTKLSIKRVQSLCRFESEQEAKDIVISMIQNGDLSASLDADGVVTFYDGTITESDKETLIRIQNGIEKTLNLWNGLDRQMLDVKQSKAYVEKSLNMSSGNMDSDLQQQLLYSANAMGGMGGMGNFFRGGGL